MVAVRFECGHDEEMTRAPRSLRVCDACDLAEIRGMMAREDALFDTDSSDDARLPAPLTEAEQANVAAGHAFLQEKAARDAAWARQEAWENSR